MNEVIRDPFSSLVDDVRSGILSALGEPAVVSMFVTGSVAKDEGIVFAGKDGDEVYSDVDIAVVVADDADLGAYRRRMAEVSRSVELVRDGVRHFSRPDIGVYSRSQYGSQPARPGTVGIPAAHVLLHGDAEVPMSFDPPPATIETEEALYLIENRLTELAEAAGALPNEKSAMVVRGAHYAALKAAADAATAVLVATGAYHPLRSARTERFAAAPERKDLLGTEAVEWVSACSSDLQNAATALESDPATVLKAAGRTTAVLVELWCAIAARHFDRGRDEVADLFLMRCEAGRQTAHLRQAFVLSKRIGERKHSLIHGALTKRAWVIADLLPMAALRVSSTVEAHAARESDPTMAHTRVTRYLDALTRSFGYRDGTVYQRARKMYKDAIS